MGYIDDYCRSWNHSGDEARYLLTYIQSLPYCRYSNYYDEILYLGSHIIMISRVCLGLSIFETLSKFPGLSEIVLIKWPNMASRSTGLWVSGTSMSNEDIAKAEACGFPRMQDEMN